MQEIFSKGDLGAKTQRAPNPFVNLFYQLGGAKVIEDLQHHQDDGIYKCVDGMIEKYFCEET